MNDICFSNTGESHIQAHKTPLQLLMVDAQGVQNRSMHVSYMNGVFNDRKRVIGLAVADSGFTPPPAIHRV